MGKCKGWRHGRNEILKGSHHRVTLYLTMFLIKCIGSFGARHLRIWRCNNIQLCPLTLIGYVVYHNSA